MNFGESYLLWSWRALFMWEHPYVDCVSPVFLVQRLSSQFAGRCSRYGWSGVQSLHWLFTPDMAPSCHVRSAPVRKGTTAYSSPGQPSRNTEPIISPPIKLVSQFAVTHGDSGSQSVDLGPTWPPRAPCWKRWTHIMYQANCIKYPLWHPGPRSRLSLCP